MFPSTSTYYCFLRLDLNLFTYGSIIIKNEDILKRYFTPYLVYKNNVCSYRWHHLLLSASQFSKFLFSILQIYHSYLYAYTAAYSHDVNVFQENVKKSYK